MACAAAGGMIMAYCDVRTAALLMTMSTCGVSLRTAMKAVVMAAASARSTWMWWEPRTA